MEKDLIFFGDNGMTQTSANHIANMCKEYYSSLEKSLNSIRFYTTKVKLIGSNEESLISEGVDSVSHVESYLKSIAKLKSLIAWLREAIKAKERLIKEAQDGGYDYYGIEIPELPEKEAYATENDVIATLGIKERNRYYYLGAFCSTIGEYIHKGGVFSRERDALMEVVHKPNEVSGSGRDTIIYTKTPSLNVNEVEDAFMSLQNTYREYQAELNSIKYQIENTVRKDNSEKDIEYSKKYEVYSSQMSAAAAVLSEKRNEAVRKASDLKIVVPDSLKDIYEEVRNLGKK